MIYISGFITVILFILVMFYVNPTIDSHYGLEVLKLQISFYKDAGIDIVNVWNDNGIKSFFNLIWIDYIYALNYSIFFYFLLIKLHVKSWYVYTPFIAGLFDWIENTIEILFLRNIEEFSNSLFFLHSVIASIKWLFLPIVVYMIFYNLFSRSKKQYI